MQATTINQEALSSSRLASDVDGFRRRYTMKEVSDIETISIEFVSPKIICFEDYRFFLLQNCTTELLNSKYYYRPDYLSYDEYSTTNFWNLLMFINEVPTIEKFKIDNVLIPSISAILKISKDVIQRNATQELVPINELFYPETEKLFYYKQPTPKLVAPINQLPPFVPSNLYFYKESFTINIISAKQRAVDLKYTPVIDSVQIKVQNQPAFIYNKHYTIIKNNGVMNRLTWDPAKIQNGIGMVDVLSEGSILEVQYSRLING